MNLLFSQFVSHYVDESLPNGIELNNYSYRYINLWEIVEGYWHGTEMLALFEGRLTVIACVSSVVLYSPVF